MCSMSIMAAGLPHYLLQEEGRAGVGEKPRNETTPCNSTVAGPGRVGSGCDVRRTRWTAPGA